MSRNSKQHRFSDTLIANAQASLELKQKQAIEEMARRGKYDTTNGMPAIKAVRSSS